MERAELKSKDVKELVESVDLVEWTALLYESIPSDNIPDDARKTTKESFGIALTPEPRDAFLIRADGITYYLNSDGLKYVTLPTPEVVVTGNVKKQLPFVNPTIDIPEEHARFAAVELLHSLSLRILGYQSVSLGALHFFEENKNFPVAVSFPKKAFIK